MEPDDVVVTDEASTPEVEPDLQDPALYINRELSWLQFNARVLEEALDERTPLLERVKFLAIFANNLDEFFMIRVSGLRRQVEGGAMEIPPDGMTPSQQLAAIQQTLSLQLTQQADCWQHDLLPRLREAGVHLLRYNDLQLSQRDWLRAYFASEVFPILTPLAFDPAHPFPLISNLSLNLAVAVRDPEHGERFARLKVSDVVPRLIHLPDAPLELLDAPSEIAPRDQYVWLEDVVTANLDLLFPGLEVVAAYPFRVTRDADIEIKDDEASDLLTIVEEHVGMRHFASAVRLEIDRDTPATLRDMLMRNLKLAPSEVYAVPQPLGFADLMQLTRIDRQDLKDQPFLSAVPAALAGQESLLAAIRQDDILLYHPYDSFAPVIDFVREAAKDPQVVAIKQTLYRAGPDSPIIEALIEAREHGKQVAVLVELKARFDEENNIAWARALEDAGVHVVYGVLGLKTHAKICLVIRREADGMRRYVHMGTGNYNPLTSRVYTDLGLFTADTTIGADVSDLFNALTGYAEKRTYEKLLVAPGSMRQQIIERIEREAQRQRTHGDGYLALKMNALVDKQCIQALYAASRAGVRIDLQVRGICCLRPGLPGISETISVTSIVGRFLEHARIYYFRNGGEEEVLLGSADLMPRNLDRRVEMLFPIESAQLRRVIIDDILQVHLQDNVQARRLLPDGSYERLQPAPGEPARNSQAILLTSWREGNLPN